MFAVTAPAIARGQGLSALDFGLVPDAAGDQTERLREALAAASASGRTLVLPPGTFLVQSLDLPGNLVIEGTPGRTFLAGYQGEPVAVASGVTGLVLRHLGFESDRASPMGSSALLSILASADVRLDTVQFRNSGGMGVRIEAASARISDSDFSGLGDAAIHAMDSTGVFIAGNTIATCGNAGIRIWRSESGADGSIISGNRIAGIDWRDGGNGQNGNGINIYKADEVVVSDNHIADCAFTAVRLNAARNTIVSGNICLRSGEVAIFSEFGFSGSVIADNIVDGAAFGISMTNMDQGGELAICSGNIVRNISPTSLVNPDTTPNGIFAEAKAIITGNTVQNVPGIALGAGFGPYLDTVSITNNVVIDCAVGVGVSVVEDCGPVHIANNLITAPTLHAAIGMRWSEITETDLFANAAKYPHVTVSGNVVTGA